MIRALEKRDCGAVFSIVNENWRTVYGGYVNPDLLSAEGCMRRNGELVRDFAFKRFWEYVFEENGGILGMISFGKTDGRGLPDAFEIRRLYVERKSQGRGIGAELLGFAEDKAEALGYGTIVIWAFKENSRALAFYEKHGYRIDSEEYLGEPYLAVGARLVKEIR